MSRIVEFYSGQTIFLTGVTGFVGKIVLMKLLESCPNINEIYCLVRGRNTLSSRDRFDRDVLSLHFFQNLYRKNPHILGKIKVVEGDISLNGLGMDPGLAKEMQEKVTIIIHGAATTRFNETLKVAVQLNTLGARKMLSFGKLCSKLVSYIHISTSYVNCINNAGDVKIREEIYPFPVDPNGFLERMSVYSEEELVSKTEGLIMPYPNTYTYSKALAEHFILDERGDVPLAIVRPSIVGCAYEYPVHGWVDSKIGANGLLLMCGIGALHAMRGRGSFVSDIIPVDILVMIILTVCYYTSLHYGRERGGNGDSSLIFHATTSTRNPVTWSRCKDIISDYFRRHPPKNIVGYPYAIYIPNKYLHRLMYIILCQIPAAFADLKNFLGRKKVQNLNVSYRLLQAVDSLAYFTTHQWFFSTDNMNLLNDVLNEKDLDLFPIDVQNINWDLYFLRYSHGLKKYLLNESDDYVEEITLSPLKSKF